MASIASLRRMSAAQLAAQILAGPSQTQKLAIVDVRDDDYIGGHIKGCLHFPSGSLDATLPSLMRQLEDADTVVFHCALSQQRGPSAALRYLRERERLQTSSAGSGACKEQAVYVLDQGFSGWQELHGEDQRLTEGFLKELWRDVWR